MTIRSLLTIDFPPFAEGTVDFPHVSDCPKELAEVHLLTGVNGAGKSRLLCAIAAALGEEKPLKERCAGGGAAQFGIMFQPDADGKPVGFRMTLGSSGISVAGAGGETLRRELRSVPAYASAGGAYLREGSDGGHRDWPRKTLLSPVSDDAQLAPLLFHKPRTHTADFMQALTHLYVKALADKQEGRKQSRAGKTLETIFAALKETTDSVISLRLGDAAEPQLELLWRGQTLALNQLPDGLRALLGWMVDAALMLDMVCGRERDPFTTPSIILLDEVEAHLHPKWQRKLLPAFQRMFPAGQIFVATHSPFVISSLNCGWIHVLKAREDGKIVAEPPQPASAGDSYPSVLAEIMDVDEWYDVETEDLLAEFRKLRDAALTGNALALAKAQTLGKKIGERSHTLGSIMGAELARLERQPTKRGLRGPIAKKHGLPGPKKRGLSKPGAAKA